jgi:hypothetical protein
MYISYLVCSIVPVATVKLNFLPSIFILFFYGICVFVKKTLFLFQIGNQYLIISLYCPYMHFLFKIRNQYLTIISLYCPYMHSWICIS